MTERLTWNDVEPPDPFAGVTAGAECDHRRPDGGLLRVEIDGGRYACSWCGEVLPSPAGPGCADCLWHEAAMRRAIEKRVPMSVIRSVEKQRAAHRATHREVA